MSSNNVAISPNGKLKFFGSGNSVIMKPMDGAASCIWSSGPFRLQAKNCSAKNIKLNDLSIKKLLEQHGAATSASVWIK